MISQDYKLFKQYLARDWYVQGFSATPLFLSAAAISGTFMKKYLGFGYRHFLFRYHDGYGEMAYDPQDLKRVWRIVKRKLQADPNYLKKVKALYFKNLRRYEGFIKKVSADKLAKLSEDALIKIFQALVLAEVDSVGVAHIIDAIGMEIEDEFKARLKKELPAREAPRFNEIFSRLITPSQSSFVNQEEKELLAIKGGIKNKAALERHAAKYFWLQNSYCGPKYLRAADFRQKLISLRREKRPAIKASPLNFKLSPELEQSREIIDYCAVWQDERKVLIFKNIHYLGLVVEEISQRLASQPEYFYYLGLNEIAKIKSLADLSGKIKILQERRAGCLLIIKGLSVRLISGSSYSKLLPGRRSLIKDQKTNSGLEIHGTVANMGTVQGRVRIIKYLKDLKDFQAGDVLVASMTRPEYMSAIKKAAAIVTDEGGITCHAAIIARELNIPTVIGTKLATQVLHNGQMVEVRANHGLIRII